MTKKRLNKEQTANKIMNVVNSTVGYSMNMKKFEKKRDNADFLIKACEFVRCEPVYYNN